jgi:diacylglycerol kinase
MKKWLSSASHALNGIIVFFSTERNARIEGVAAILALGLGVWLHISFVEWCLVLFCIGGVLSAEAFNSAIERLSDLHTREHHPEIGKIKDIAAGAVLILAIISSGVGIIIFGPKLFLFFHL